MGTASVGINCGMPQGSVLGPLFFIILMTDLMEVRKPAKIISFADDTALVVNAINSITKVARWVNVNGLVLNMNKTKMRFGGTADTDYLRSVQVHEPDLGGLPCCCVALERVAQYKYGLTVEQNLKFKEHARKTMNKVRSGVATIFRVRHMGSMASRRSVYSASVKSNIRYMLPLYGGTFASTIDPILRLQSKAVRTIRNVERNAHAGPLYTRTGILNYIQLYGSCTVAIMCSKI